MNADQRTLDLQKVAKDIERMANRHISVPITITFEKMKPMSRAEDREKQKFLVINGEEYFFIYCGKTLLYVVNVSADSILTAAHELLEKIARKF